MLFRRSTLSERQEAAVQKTLQNLRAQRRNRFRILACIDGTEEALNGSHWRLSNWDTSTVPRSPTANFFKPADDAEKI